MKKLTQKEWLSCNFFVPPRKKSWLGGGRFQIFLECSPRKLGKMNPNLTCAYFSDGLKLNHQPVEPFLWHASQRLCWVWKNQNWGYLRYALGLPSYGVLVPKKNEGHATQDGHAVFSSKMPKRNARQEKLTYPPDVWHIWRWWFSELPQVGYVNFLEGRFLRVIFGFGNVTKLNLPNVYIANFEREGVAISCWKYVGLET